MPKCMQPSTAHGDLVGSKINGSLRLSAGEREYPTAKFMLMKLLDDLQCWNRTKDQPTMPSLGPSATWANTPSSPHEDKTIVTKMLYVM